MYGYRQRNFPESYSFRASEMEFRRDPDWSVKIECQRFHFKKYFFVLLFVAYLFKRRFYNVAEFDRKKRFEQRNMQNKEVEQVQNKLVRFILFKYVKGEYNQITQKFPAQQKGYLILWYDAKMINYTNLLSSLEKRRINQAKIVPMLVVDRPDIAENVDKLREECSDDVLKGKIQVVLKRELSDQEQLMQTFGEEGTNDAPENEEIIDLDMKKNFFYVINPKGKIIDCAEIYSFLHEDNIYQRIVAKILRDVDDDNEN